MEQEQKPLVGIIGLTLEGLAWGAVLAHGGNHVLCTDMDEEVVNGCTSDELPGMVLNLEPLLQEVMGNKSLEFTTAVRQVIKKCQVIFVDAMLPLSEEGASSLRFLEAIVGQIANIADEDRHIVVRSVVPPGSARALQEKVDATLEKRELENPLNIKVMSMPQLYGEGHLLTVMGRSGALPLGMDGETEIPDALKVILEKLPNGLGRTQVCTTVEAEISAYAYSGFVSMYQGYVNSLGDVCKAYQGDLSKVTWALNHQISGALGHHSGSIGFGGAHLTRETKELVALSKGLKKPLVLPETALKINEKQAKAKVKAVLKELGKGEETIAVLGASPVPNTDDFRDAPALDVVKALALTGNNLRFYTPHGVDQVKWRLYKERGEMAFSKSVVDATKGASVVVILGKWRGAERILGKGLLGRMVGTKIIDTVHLFSKEKAQNLGFDYYTI